MAEHDHHDLPGPSLWPVGFAVGIATLLVGLIVSTIVAVIGGILVVLFGALWVYELVVKKDVVEQTLPEADGATPERALGEPVPATAGGAAMPPGDRFPRSHFLEASTLGLGAVIGAVVTVPVVGFAVVPAFVHQGHPDVDLGPLDNFPEGEFRVATFMQNPAQGEVTRRTAYVRYNGFLGKEPSFTIMSNHCAHLGCPVQPGGPIDDAKAKTLKLGSNEVTLIPTIPAGGFICPCHGGSYDTEGNRIAGPPVRALDRYGFKIVNGNLVLTSTFSVAKVNGTGADAKIEKTDQADPGQHVDGPEAWLYPIQPPHS